MLRIKLGSVGIVSVLFAWSCGSSSSSKAVHEDGGADTGGAADVAGSGTIHGGGVGGDGATTTPGDAGQPNERGAAGAPLGGASNVDGAAGQAGSMPESAAAGAGGAPSVSCTLDPTVCQDGEVCSDGACQNVAGALAGLLWKLPCTGDLSSNVCSTIANTSVTTQLGGATGITYDVKLHFRGVVEQKTYGGGCSDGSYWLTGGAPNGDSYNVYRLSISSPPQTFYLNRGTSSIERSWALDFVQTLRIDAGATVTLFADAIDGQEIKNRDDSSQPISIPNVSLTQPFDGQFIQMDVESVAADAVGSHSSVGQGTAGSALSFNGAQWATVLDAEALHAASVTQEGWFNFAAPSGAYSSLFGKPYGTGSQDSYTIWFQDSALHAGIGAASTSGVPFVPWTTYGEWHHAALTYDSTSQVQTLYVDGLPVSCLPAGGAVLYDSHALLLGADIDNGSTNGFFNGTLDELRLFSVARTPAQIWADMHTHRLDVQAGLVGQWTFDEGSGQTTADSSGNSLSAVLGTTDAVETADPTWVTSTLPR